MTAVSGALLFARAGWGPFRFVTAVRSPLNLESLFGVSATLVLLGRLRKAEPEDEPEEPGLFARDWLMLAAIPVIGLALLWQSLGCPFLSDDFYLVSLATRVHGYSAALLKHGGGTEFFRPVGGLALAATGRLFGSSPMLWHLASLLLHLLNSTLLFLLARRLTFSRLASLAAALLFALHGTRPEAVTWIAGRFDLLATFFVLSALLLYPLELRNRPPLRYWGSLALMVLAILSKESAYAFPLLMTAVVAMRSGGSWRHQRRTVPFWAVAAGLFAVRWWALGGIGGYTDSRTGRPEAFAFGILPILKASAWRIWSALYFPINWSVEPSRGLAVCLAFGAALIVWILCTASLERRRVWFAVAFVLIAAAPALPQLLIGADLQKSRLLYLPSAGFCLLLGAAIEGLRSKQAAVLAALVLIAFQWLSWRHNLRIWNQVGDLADATCSQIAREVSPSTQQVIVRGMPGSIDGVYFLRNGLSSCIDLKTSRNQHLQVPASGPAGPAAIIFDWDAAKDSLRREQPRFPAP